MEGPSYVDYPGFSLHGKYGIRTLIKQLGWGNTSDWAARALISIGKPAVPELLSVLSDVSAGRKKNLMFSISAIQTVGSIGYSIAIPEAVKPLTSLLNDERLGLTVIAALGKVCSQVESPETVDALLEPFHGLVLYEGSRKDRCVLDALEIMKGKYARQTFLENKIIYRCDEAFAAKISLEEIGNVMREHLRKFREKEPDSFSRARALCLHFYLKVASRKSSNAQKLELPGELLPARIKAPKNNGIYRVPQRRLAL
jgi:hypothetical protein